MAAAASAARVYTRLRELDCPPLRGVYLSDSDDLLRLLCAPSAHRLDILEWICTCVYPPFREQFSSLKDSQSDVKIKEIAQLGSDILLCQADDLDLVKVTSCPTFSPPHLLVVGTRVGL
uniref:HAUS augmin like complex subunit 7 n=1 Tax=Sphenodon punctatus TaxID=8508 RepID=A0A8D0HCQ7_SPHPU